MIDFKDDRPKAAALLTPNGVSNLLLASFFDETPLLRALRISLLLSCSVEGICRARIEDIDHRGRRIKVRNGTMSSNPVSCGGIAFDQILKSIRGRATGTILIDEVGEPLIIDQDAEAYAIELVADADPNFHSVAWDFASALRSTQTILAVCGHPLEAIDAQNGKVNWPKQLRPSELPKAQAFAAANLEWILLDELDAKVRHDTFGNDEQVVVFDIEDGDGYGGRS